MRVFGRDTRPAKRFQITAVGFLGAAVIRVEDTNTTPSHCPFWQRVDMPDGADGQCLMNLVVFLFGRNGDSAGNAVTGADLPAIGMGKLGVASPPVVLNPAAEAIPGLRRGCDHANRIEDAGEHARALIGP